MGILTSGHLPNGNSGLSASGTALRKRSSLGDSSANAQLRFGPLTITPLSPADASKWVALRASRQEPCVVVTSNINHLRLAETDANFRAALQRSELNVADGWPLVLASRLVGPVLPGRVAGIDLVASVLGADRPLRVAIIGGPAGAAEMLARRLRVTHRICLVEPLPKGSWEHPEGLMALKSAIREARPNLILLGIGPPRQELLAEALRPVVRGPILCCGATIEILAGVRPRAPAYLQAVGLEWAFRLALEPRRLWSRYLFSALSFGRVMCREALRRAAPDSSGTRPA
jgi:N-acetylglucosaminyldiphosphoundecaprenol N-acetyl-beta-D-mannosaminyltransferase